MIGIGPVEMLVILIVTLIAVGPEKMPELARNLAKLMRDLRNAMDDVREQFDEFTREDLLPTKEIDSYYRETIDSVKKSIEPPPDMPDMKAINKEIEQSLQQPENAASVDPNPSISSPAKPSLKNPENPAH